MIVKIQKHQLSAELAQVFLKILEDECQNKIFPNGILKENSLTLTKEAEEKYNETYSLIDEIIDDLKI